MKKLFLAICFICCLASTQKSLAEVSTIEEAEIASRQPKAIEPVSLEGMPDGKNLEEVRAFFKQRFQTANVSDSKELGDLNKNNAIDIQHSAEYIQNVQEAQKSTFQKIYDQALGRIDQPQAEFSPDTVFYEQVKKQNSSDPNKKIDIPVIKVTLPNGDKVLAPAKEHIPYILTSYHILPTGTIEVDEEVIVVANGDKLKNGLKKSMPKYTTSRSKVKKKLDITLLSATINKMEIPYKLKEVGNQIYFVPKEKYTLEPGVYTYRFKYLLNRKLWYYDDFTEFYTDITGGYPNFVVTSANAIVSVPDGKTFMSQLAMAGYPKTLSDRRTVIARLGANALGFASVVPLNAGEGMHILTSLDKTVFNKPSLGDRFVWFVTDYGNILFAILGFMAVYMSYMFSWKQIRKNKSHLNIRFKQSAALTRYILNNVYDCRSFVCGLLELTRLKIIDIKQEAKTLMLIKKTDNLKSLPGSLKAIMSELFTKTDSMIEVKTQNKLKFTRAQTSYAKYIKRRLKFLTWKLNTFYLIFSLSMLAVTVFAISYIAINPFETSMILVSAIITLMFYMWFLRYQFSGKIVRYIIRCCALIFIVLTTLLLGIYIRLLSALLIAATVYVIIEYSSRFTTKNGLMKSKTTELEKLKQYLVQNAQQVAQSKEFEIQQANIFALELEDKYEQNPKNEKVYRLDLAKQLLKLI